MADRGERPGLGPVLCLGTRNGREVDLFRLEFFGGRPAAWAAKVLEVKNASFRSRLPWLEARGRSQVEDLGSQSVIGVELNPQAARSDIWLGSFDQMPPEWTGRFKVVYSNSFDQSQDPGRTAAEWLRVTAPGGYLILAFTAGAEPSLTDPVGQLSLDDLQGLFPGELIFFHHWGSANGYSEAVIRRPAGDLEQNKKGEAS
ncbi:MAG: hypothetical protein JRJ59_07280 [Deltaproteobacteria bacterium]|nr:hypothetical protein [Deltaproteobacteria bacterium]